MKNKEMPALSVTLAPQPPAQLRAILEQLAARKRRCNYCFLTDIKKFAENSKQLVWVVCAPDDQHQTAVDVYVAPETVDHTRYRHYWVAYLQSLPGECVCPK